GHAARGANRISLHEGGDYLRAALRIQSVHTLSMLERSSIVNSVQEGKETWGQITPTPVFTVRTGTYSDRARNLTQVFVPQSLTTRIRGSLVGVRHLQSDGWWYVHCITRGRRANGALRVSRKLDPAHWSDSVCRFDGIRPCAKRPEPSTGIYQLE